MISTRRFIRTNLPMIRQTSNPTKIPTAMTVTGGSVQSLTVEPVEPLEKKPFGVSSVSVLSRRWSSANILVHIILWIAYFLVGCIISAFIT